MRIQRPTITQITELKGDGAQLTGSFSGSFNTWEGISGKPDPLLSSSAQIADDISGSLSVTHVNTKVPGLVSGSAQIADDISGSLSATHVNTKVPGILSGSAQIADDISGSLSVAHVNTKVPGLLSGSAQIADNISGSFTSTSASIAADIVDNASDVTGLNTYTSSLKSAISVSGANTTLLGDLTVTGTRTELQVANLNVEDLNITVASGSANAAAANGAGLTVAGASATLTYASTGDKWVVNKQFGVPINGLIIDGTVVTATAAELNLLDGSSAGTVVNSKGVIYSAGGKVNATQFQIGGVDVDNDIATLSLPASTTISAFGKTLVDDADAATARTTIGLGNVTNESKATMFSSPTFTGTVSGVTATHVGLGNVTNESKATMFSSPTFTGTVSGVTATHVGLGNVTNESKATMFSSPTFTGTVSGVTATHVGLGTSADVQFDSLGIGTAASGTTGEIRATGDITAYYSSDERLKENFKTLDGALDKVNQLNGYEFDWKDGIEDVVSKKGHDIGVKAQEVQALYPELVHERDNGYLAVDYVKLTAVLLQAVKELSAKVDELSK